MQYRFILLFLSVLIIYQTTYAQTDTVSFSELTYTKQGQYLGDVLFTGIGVKKDKNGNLLAIATFEEGLPIGKSLNWYANGNLAYENHFKKGKNMAFVQNGIKTDN